MLIARLIKTAKRCGISRNSSAFLFAELTMFEALSAGYSIDVAYDLARSVLTEAEIHQNAEPAVQAA